MAVNGFFRNQFTALETGGRAKRAPRLCVDCGTGIDSQGGKKRCGPCSDLHCQAAMRAYQVKYKAKQK
jgi:hypothetical protein